MSMIGEQIPDRGYRYSGAPFHIPSEFDDLDIYAEDASRLIAKEKAAEQALKELVLTADDEGLFGTYPWCKADTHAWYKADTHPWYEDGWGLYEDVCAALKALHVKEYDTWLKRSRKDHKDLRNLLSEAKDKAKAKAKGKTTKHSRMPKHSRMLLMYLMQDCSSYETETRFPRFGTVALIPGGASQQTKLANDNNNTILEDSIVMPDGRSQEMGELKMISNGLERRINILDDDDGSASSSDDDVAFPCYGTATLIPDGAPQQTKLANDNNNTILGDSIVTPDGRTQEMGELEMTSNGLERRINIRDDEDGSASSGADDDGDRSASSGDDDDDDGDGNGSASSGDDDDSDDDGSALSGDDEVQPRGPRFPNGINNAILGFTGQAMAAIVAANSPHSFTVRLFAYAAGMGFYGSLFAALFLRRYPNIAKTLFKIGVSTSAFTVMIALGPYLPTQWYLNIAVPAVACLIIAVMVALSQLD